MTAGYSLTQGADHSIRGAADAGQALQVDPRSSRHNEATVNVSRTGRLVHLDEGQKTVGLTTVDTQMAVAGSGNLLLRKWRAIGPGEMASGGAADHGQPPGANSTAARGVQRWQRRLGVAASVQAQYRGRPDSRARS